MNYNGFRPQPRASAWAACRAGNDKGIRIMRKSLWGGLLLSLAILGHAEATSRLSSLLQPGHPDTYTVKRGDTLWDISGRFLTKPWVWPELWHANPQIENPNLIYPGDVLHLEYVDGEPRLTLEQRGDRSGAGGDDGGSGFGRSGSGKLQPRVRESPLASAIPAIRLDAIQGFLVGHRVVTPDEFSAAPYVLGGDSKRIILGAGDKFYVKGSVATDAAYGIYRKGALYVDPDTKDVLGLEATDIGVGQVVDSEKDVGTVIVSSSSEEVRRGDRLLRTEERRLVFVESYTWACAVQVQTPSFKSLARVTRVNHGFDRDAWQPLDGCRFYGFATRDFDPCFTHSFFCDFLA